MDLVSVVDRVVESVGEVTGPDVLVRRDEVALGSGPVVVEFVGRVLAWSAVVFTLGVVDSCVGSDFGFLVLLLIDLGERSSVRLHSSMGPSLSESVNRAMMFCDGGGLVSASSAAWSMARAVPAIVDACNRSVSSSSLC